MKLSNHFLKAWNKSQNNEKKEVTGLGVVWRPCQTYREIEDLRGGQGKFGKSNLFWYGKSVKFRYGESRGFKFILKNPVS